VKIYIGGPIRGWPLYNFPAFEAATDAVRSLGHEVFSPAERDLSKGFNPELTIEEQGFSVREAMEEDLTWITRHAEALVMLPLWECSKGANAEAWTAWALGLPVYELEDFLTGALDEVLP
jgi:uncharacterized protein DUF4406